MKRALALLVMLASSASAAAVAVTVATKPKTEYIYDFIVNAPSPHEISHDDFGIHITDIRMDGTRVTPEQIEILVEPGHAKCNSKEQGYECDADVYGMIDDEPSGPEYEDLTWSAWKDGETPIGTKIFTITSPNKVSQFTIDYFRPKYVPGFIIKENGVEVLKETESSGSDETEPTPKTITYSIA